MSQRIRPALWALSLALSLHAQTDPGCPVYPSAVRTELEQSLSLDREFQAWARTSGKRLALRPRAGSSSSVIDQLINQRMATDGVTPAPRATDSEFLRRIYLDL